MKKSNKKCIAIFSAYIPPHVGGIERYTLNLAKQFVRLGYQPIIVTSNYNNMDGFEVNDDIIVIRLPIYNLFKNRYPMIKFSKKTKLLKRKLDDYKVERVIVNARFYLNSFIGVRFANKRNIPVYVIEHGSNYVTLNNKFIDFFANRYEDLLTLYLKKRVNGFYGVSNACGKWLERFGIKYSGTWYNSIDCDQKVLSKVQHEGINFLYAGRVIKQKGIYNILVSFEKLSKKYDDIYLYVAGDGYELEKYKSQFSCDRIYYLGKLDYKELLEYYAKCDVFLYPPLYPEGLPTSILEAGLMKCAVIGTDMGGIKEIINNGENGIMVSSERIDLENAMDKLVVDKVFREKLALALYNTVRERFAWNVTAKKILRDINLK